MAPGPAQHPQSAFPAPVLSHNDWEVGAGCFRHGVMGHGWAEGVAVSGARGQGIRGGRAGGVEGGGRNSGSSE